jgi:uncharacterized coiled-coil protein SlyX
MDAKQPKPKAKASPSLLQPSSTAKKLRRAPHLASPYSSQVNLSQTKKPVGKFNSRSPEHTTEGHLDASILLNKTFVLSKGGITDTSENSAKVSLTLPVRKSLAEFPRKSSVGERALQTKLNSIKTIEFNILREVFDETLNQMTTYRQVLEEIKQGYDARICSLEELSARQETQIKGLQMKLEDERRDKTVFQSRIKKLAQENYQLSV